MWKINVGLKRKYWFEKLSEGFVFEIVVVNYFVWDRNWLNIIYLDMLFFVSCSFILEFVLFFYLYIVNFKGLILVRFFS